MFNDFKNLHFDVTKRKIGKLFDIFQRLGLSSLEERYKLLLEKFNLLTEQLDSLSNHIILKQEENPNWPIIIPPTPPAPGMLPDLAIISMIPTVYTRYVNFKITIQNIGTIVSPASSVDVIVPNIFSRSLLIPALEPNEQYSINTQHSFSDTGEPLSITGLAEVNPLHLFTESNYNNNQYSVPAIIKSEYVLSPSLRYVILHAHNPEVIELGYFAPSGNPIVYIVGSSTDTFSTPSFLSQHAVYQQLSSFNISSLYHAYCEWNGITVDLGMIEILPGKVTELFFTFPRIQTNISWDYDGTALLDNYINPISGGVLTDFSLTSPLAALSYRETGFFYATGYGTFNFDINMEDFIMQIRAVRTGGLGTIATYVGQYGAFPPVDQEILINIPVQSFNTWWCQALLVGTYPGITLNGASILSGKDMSVPDPYYSLQTLPANIEYTAMRFWIGGNVSTTNDNADISKDYTGSIFNGFKFSSIPYDLLNGGF
jgi:hypothetical protein